MASDFFLHGREGFINHKITNKRDKFRLRCDRATVDQRFEGIRLECEWLYYPIIIYKITAPVQRIT